jgi:hypothetical protein
MSNFKNINMKTNALNRKAIEHLELIGYKLQKPIEEMCDSPYLFITNEEVQVCYSATQFRDSSRKLISQEKVLKLRPISEQKDIKKLSKKQQDMYKLMKLLNNSKNSKITGYDVSWTIQQDKYDKYSFELLPISPYACGSISMEHLEIILQFAKEHRWISCSIGYTNWNNEKQRYGTSTPCVHMH